MRDTHMRKRVFEIKEGVAPDIHFSAKEVLCKEESKALTCPVKGQLSIRGVEKPFAMNVKISEKDGKKVAQGDGVVKLSDYGIPQPEQFGVKVENEIQLKLNLSAK